MKINNSYLLPKHCKIVLRSKEQIESAFAEARAKKERCGDARALVGDEYFNGFLDIEKQAHKSKRPKLRFLGGD